jgi:hypothetical protein
MDKLLSCVDATGVLPEELSLFHGSGGGCAILDHIVIDHGLSFLLSGDVKADNFVNTIVDSFIQLVRLVGRHNYDNFLRGRTRSIQERVN